MKIFNAIPGLVAKHRGYLFVTFHDGTIAVGKFTDAQWVGPGNGTLELVDIWGSLQVYDFRTIRKLD